MSGSEATAMLRVTGVLPGGQVYEVKITGQAERPVIGSRLVAAMVEAAQRSGALVRPSPTEAPLVVDGADSRSVLALLEERSSRILGIHGMVPRPEEVHVAGTVY
ncbi:hypothetical protein [Kitasatospora sp. NPDC094016]|uniref:hypothetical protein n=1 Tax=Kitasatospora sp. NPDC094016 TaxID=3154986 RepID=UPI00332232D0